MTDSRQHIRATDVAVSRSAMAAPLVAILLAVLLAIVAWCAWPVTTVAIVDETTGTTLALIAAEGDATLRLSYVHSIYRQPGVEEFAVREDGLYLVRISSPSVAVLEYYARPEPIESTGSGYAIQVAPTIYQRLPVKAGPVGQRTVSYAGREIPLHERAGSGDRVTLSVARVPRLLTWRP